MRRLSGALYFVLGVAFGALVGGQIVAATSGATAAKAKAGAQRIISECEVLWAIVELQSRSLGQCDRVMNGLGLAGIELAQSKEEVLR